MALVTLPALYHRHVLACTLHTAGAHSRTIQLTSTHIAGMQHIRSSSDAPGSGTVVCAADCANPRAGIIVPGVSGTGMQALQYH